MKSHKQLSVGFIGGGNMAQAILRGLIAAGHEPGRIAVADPASEQRETITSISPAIDTCADNIHVAEKSDLLVLAVKPQFIHDVATEITNARPAEQVVVSVAAGVTLTSMQQWFGRDVQAVRVMPNQPSLVGEGMSGMCATAAVTESDRAAAEYLLGATGEVVWFEDESLLDAVTAVSGSGPAYFYLVLEIMQEVGIELGLDSATARLLSCQTARGAAAVAAASDESVAELRHRVTSPGGTTAAALEQLESAGIRDMFRRALTAARDRSMELGSISPAENGN